MNTRNKRLFPLLCLVLLCLLALSPVEAAEETPYFTSVPALLHIGQYAEFFVEVPEDCTGSLLLIGDQMRTTYTLMSGYPLEAGENRLLWGGFVGGEDALPVGEYTLRLLLSNGAMAQEDVRIGLPRPRLTGIQQSHFTLDQEGGVLISCTASEAGTLGVQVFRFADNTIVGEVNVAVEAGINTINWNGMMDGEMVPDGEYALVLSLRNGMGAESAQHYLFIDVQSTAVHLQAFNDMTGAIMAYELSKPSPPYSQVDDGTYWAMTPGETDDAVIWDILTQPITVYDDGRIRSMGHVYMKENPDGTGANVAQIHGLSQGLHVVGEVNEHGYVLVEAFSNYDPQYQPLTVEEKLHAFDLRRGYLKAEHLKTTPVQQDIGFVIDKLTQRMYMFRDGERVTEFTISTGRITQDKWFYETIAGEFITITFGGGYWSNDIYSDMAIRFNGGTMLHEVPHTVGEDGTKYYGMFERHLGAKHSAGCVRVPYRLNEEGYNQAWIWNNLDSRGHYKIIIWDDINRNDTPATWR